VLPLKLILWMWGSTTLMTVMEWQTRVFVSVVLDSFQRGMLSTVASQLAGSGSFEVGLRLRLEDLSPSFLSLSTLPLTVLLTTHVVIPVPYTVSSFLPPPISVLHFPYIFCTIAFVVESMNPITSLSAPISVMSTVYSDPEVVDELFLLLGSLGCRPFILRFTRFGTRPPGLGDSFAEAPLSDIRSAPGEGDIDFRFMPRPLLPLGTRWAVGRVTESAVMELCRRRFAVDNCESSISMASDLRLLSPDFSFSFSSIRANCCKT